MKDLVYELKAFSLEKLKAAFKSLVEGHLTPAIPALDNLLQIISKSASVCYYFLDNLFWVISVGNVSDKVFDRKKWKKYKDIFSLVRNWFPLFRSIISFRLTRKKLEQIESELDAYDNQVVGTTCFEATELMRKLINTKPKYYD
jgi:hypothetical protein